RDGTSCFGHSLLALDEDGEPLTDVLGWRDTRSADAAEWLSRRLDTNAVQARTGAYLHPSFWPAKLAWLAETEPETFRRAAHFVSFPEYLRGEPKTSPSIASGTRLPDLTPSACDADAPPTLRLDPELLPELHPAL